MYKRRIFLQGLASAGALMVGLASPALASTGHHGGAGTGPVSSVVRTASTSASLLQNASALDGLVDSQPNVPGVSSLARLVGGPGDLGPGAAGQAVNGTIGGLAGAATGLNSLSGNLPATGSDGGVAPAGASGLGSLASSLGALNSGTSVLDSLLGGLPGFGSSSALGSLAGLPGLGGLGGLGGLAG